MALSDAEKFRAEQAVARRPDGKPADRKLRRAQEVDAYVRELLERQAGPPGRPS